MINYLLGGEDIMKTAVSVRGQTVIPKEIRDKLHIAEGSKLEWLVEDDKAVIIPISKDPIKAACGILKGTNVSTKSLLKYRREERLLEAKRYKRLKAI